MTRISGCDRRRSRGKTQTRKTPPTERTCRRGRRKRRFSNAGGLSLVRGFAGEACDHVFQGDKVLRGAVGLDAVPSRSLNLEAQSVVGKL